jgi:hypothetical protein
VWSPFEGLQSGTWPVVACFLWHPGLPGLPRVRPLELTHGLEEFMLAVTWARDYASSSPHQTSFQSRLTKEHRLLDMP